MSCEIAKEFGGLCWCARCWAMTETFKEFWFAELERKVREKFPVAKNTSRIYWITINPKDEATLETFLKKLEKVVTKKWIQTYYYNIEQRGESMETAGKGLHSHMLIIPSSSKRKSEVHREFYSTFKDIVGNKLHVNVQDFPDEYKLDKIEYLKGNKWDNDKQTKIATDNYFRDKNKLLMIYTNEVTEC